MKRARKLRAAGCLFLAAFVLGGGFAAWLWAELRPLAKGSPILIRYERPTEIGTVLEDLERRRVIRSAAAFRAYLWIRRVSRDVRTGTYRFAPGMKVGEVLRSLGSPLRQMVRLPETNWAARSAKILENRRVCPAGEYMALVRSAEPFRSLVEFPLPANGSLEGYLFPDTYDLPPLLGAEGVILRQLRAFEKKVWLSLGKPDDLHRAVIVGSLVELEVARDDERPIVAGVIENRLARNMPLQIDASVLYGMGVWKELTREEIRTSDSPFNTYRYRGLPPGPICSPSVASVRAALNPASHRYLYYVAMPEGYHLFSETYDQHLKNIVRRKAALRARGQ